MKIAAWQRRNDAHAGAASSRARRIVPPHALAPVASAWSGIAVADDCRDLAGRLVSVEGDVTVAERPGRMGDEICSGESVEVGARSRTAVRLEDTQTVVRIDRNSTFLIMPSDAERSWLEPVGGVIYPFSRRPESLRVDTSYVNAAIDGAEFVVEAADGTGEVTVIEGSVLVDNALGEVRVSAGERASAAAARKKDEIAVRLPASWSVSSER